MGLRATTTKVITVAPRALGSGRDSFRSLISGDDRPIERPPRVTGFHRYRRGRIDTAPSPSPGVATHVWAEIRHSIRNPAICPIWQGAKMEQVLSGKRIAILTDCIEIAELTVPRDALAAAGAEIHILNSARPQATGTHFPNAGVGGIPPSGPLDLRVDSFDALVLPGCDFSPTALGWSPEVRSFVETFIAASKPVGAISEGPALLIDTNIVRDRTLTSAPALRADLEEAGALWLEQHLVIDRNLVTSQSAHDLPAFCAALIDLFSRQPAGADFERGLEEPALFQDNPADIVQDPEKTRSEKLHILKQLESDARALSAANDEGMAGDEENSLQEVRRATHALEPPGTEDTGTPTKHGG